MHRPTQTWDAFVSAKAERFRKEHKQKALLEFISITSIS